MSEHAEDGQEAFDPEPIRQLPPDEPRTPLWMPAVGLALVALFALYVLMGGGEETAPEAAPAGGDEQAAQPPAPAAPPAPPTPEAGAEPIRPRAPSDIPDIRRQLANLRERAAAGGTARPAAPAPPTPPTPPTPPRAPAPSDGAPR